MPLALIVGWFYDITREEIVRTPPSDAGDSLEKSLQRKDYVLLASLAAVWTILYVLIHIPPAIDKSIAVLPFENRGHDPANAPFAFGIHDDLLTQLQQLSEIKVIAKPSVESIDKNLSVAEMGRQLGAAFALKGSVERVLDRVRISIILIRVEDEHSSLFTYDRRLSARNYFDIRDEMAFQLNKVREMEESGEIPPYPEVIELESPVSEHTLQRKLKTATADSVAVRGRVDSGGTLRPMASAPEPTALLKIPLITAWQ